MKLNMTIKLMLLLTKCTCTITHTPQENRLNMYKQAFIRDQGDYIGYIEE